MKKVLFVVLVVIVLVLFASCKPIPEKVTAGTPRLTDIKFSKYDAFSVMRETSKSKGIFDDVGGGVNRLFGLTQDALEKITIKDDKGLEWACNKVSKLGKDFLLMVLSCAAHAGMEYKNYIVDRAHDKVIDLSFLIDGASTDIRDFNIQATASGLFARKDSAVVDIDAESKTMKTLTNPKTDTIIAFWKNDAGDMLALSGDTVKVFPKDGRLPIEVDLGEHGYFDYSGIRDKEPMYFTANPATGLILYLREGLLYQLSSEGLSATKLPAEVGGNLNYDYGICLTDRTENGYAEKVIWYSRQGYVTIHDLSSGKLVFKKYNAPTKLVTSYIDKGKVAYWDGYLIYSTESGLYSLNLETQTTETLVEGSLSKWQLTTGGVIYTEYKSATENETYFLNLSTHEKEQLSSSNVEVVSIASFVN